jgi:glutaredoxin
VRSVTLVGKPGCHLCDRARAVVKPICANVGATFEEVSVLDDPELMDRFGEFIPVVLIDGIQHDFYRINPERFRRALLAG